MQEVPSYSCDGHWSRAFRSTSGPIYGVDASRLRGQEEVDPSAPGSADNGQYILVVPDDQRQRLGVADPFHAFALPAIVVYLLDLVVLVTVLAWITCVRYAWRQADPGWRGSVEQAFARGSK